ncbi:cuticle protein 1 [Aricia agestis]|uniref:cuticle protein 1 n=1 Tax=Aricia agestis TaxID=91739 RepID=UPI001C20172A|nr:cuticle protein 1 [Aricia agestis]
MYAKLFCLLVLAAVALAREYPAGLHPAVCPNYPYCDQNAWTKFTPDGQPIPEWVYNPSILPVAPADPYGPTKYPAGVNPALCPNYPFCR